MRTNFKIALALAGTEKAEHSLVFRLKQNMPDEKVEYPAPKQIFVLSDIEGNYKSLFKLLHKARVIDKYLQWTFEDNHLVIVGDCFDRGDQVAECLWLIYSLEEKAKKRGGHVHFILGNHEIMNMNGDWRYVHPKYAENIGPNKPHTALYGGNDELWRWLFSKNIIEKIGTTLFVHGGISEEIIRSGLSIAEINKKARPYYTRAGELFTDPFLSVVYDSKCSPFWYRGYYDGKATEEHIDATLAYFDVQTIVTGHTIINQVSSYFNGKIINVNTDHAIGISEGLLIRNNKFYRVDTVGKQEKIK